MSKRDCMNVKVEADLVRKAKVVAAARRVTLTDYVSGLLRGPIESDLARVAAGLRGDPDNTPAGAGSGGTHPSVGATDTKSRR